MFSPPYFAAFSIRGGTKRPKETATIRLIGCGGCQPVKVSISWMGRESEEATLFKGTEAHCRCQLDAIS